MTTVAERQVAGLSSQVSGIPGIMERRAPPPVLAHTPGLQIVGSGTSAGRRSLKSITYIIIALSYRRLERCHSPYQPKRRVGFSSRIPFKCRRTPVRASSGIKPTQRSSRVRTPLKSPPDASTIASGYRLDEGMVCRDGICSESLAPKAESRSHQLEYAVPSLAVWLEPLWTPVMPGSVCSSDMIVSSSSTCQVSVLPVMSSGMVFM